MPCYFRHLKPLFEEAGVTVTPENRRAIDEKIHEAVGVPYPNCPAAWSAVSALLQTHEGRMMIVRAVRGE